MATTTRSDRRVEQFGAAWERFFRTLRRARGRVPDEGVSGLTLSQYLLIEPLGDGAPRSVRELAEAAGVAAPTATRTLDGLEGAGLVQRTPSARDRRSVEISLTPAGARAVAETREWVQAGRRRIYQALTPAERADAERLLSRLADVLDELR